MVTKRLILLTLVCLSVHLCKAYDEYTYNDYQGAQVKATEPENPEEFAEENGEGDYVGLKPINVLEEAQVEAEEIEPHQDATIPENPEEFAEENGEGDYVGLKPINDLEEDAAVVEPEEAIGDAAYPETYKEYAEDLNPSTSVERWTVLITKVHTESESLEEKNIENEPEESLHPETEDAQVDVNDLEGPCRRMFKDNETDCLQNVPPPYESCQYSVDEELCSWKCECAMSATEMPYDGEEHAEHFEESHREEHAEHETPEEEQAESDVPRLPGIYNVGEGDYYAGYAEYAEYAGPEALPERECTGRTSHAMSAEKEHTDAPVEEAEEVEEEFSEGPCRRMFKANETDCLVNIPAEYDSCQYFVDEESCSWKCECAMIVTDAPHDYPAHEEAESSEGSSDSESREQTKCRKGKKKLGFKNPVVAMQGMIQWKNEDKKFKKKCCF